MTRLERSLARLRARPIQADFNDVRRVLEAYGWAQARQKGSHVTFTRTGHRPFVVPLTQGARVKLAYVDELLTVLEIRE